MKTKQKKIILLVVEMFSTTFKGYASDGFTLIFLNLKNAGYNCRSHSMERPVVFKSWTHVATNISLSVSVLHKSLEVKTHNIFLF